MLTLSNALKAGRLQEFVAQEEARGVGSVDRKEIDAAIKRLATTRTQSEGRTSHSPCGDDSSEK
jgi:hypothetical protein